MTLGKDKPTGDDSEKRLVFEGDSDNSVHIAEFNTLAATAAREAIAYQEFRRMLQDAGFILPDEMENNLHRTIYGAVGGSGLGYVLVNGSQYSVEEWAAMPPERFLEVAESVLDAPTGEIAEYKSTAGMVAIGRKELEIRRQLLAMEDHLADRAVQLIDQLPDFTPDVIGSVPDIRDLPPIVGNNKLMTLETMRDPRVPHITHLCIQALINGKVIDLYELIKMHR